jgi:DNA polymerase-3 subunit alpha
MCPELTGKLFSNTRKISLCCHLNGEIPNKILNLENQAEEALLWWKEEFKEDFYMEVMRHNQEDENR